jgi:hypothetical protein
MQRLSKKDQRFLEMLAHYHNGILDYIGRRSGTDKASLGHDYLDFYEMFFCYLRDEPITLLEIGVSGGNSIKLWLDYFQKAKVIGIDRDPSPVNWDLFSNMDKSRFVLEQGDQEDYTFLRAVGDQHGPFDIILDDASHRPEHQLGSFATLSPHIAPGGMYIVEDMVNYEVAEFFGAMATRITQDCRGIQEGDERYDMLAVYKGTALVKFK